MEGPFTHLGLDIIGPLSKTRNNNQYIIVVVDYFTKWVEAAHRKCYFSVCDKNFN